MIKSLLSLFGSKQDTKYHPTFDFSNKKNKSETEQYVPAPPTKEQIEESRKNRMFLEEVLNVHPLSTWFEACWGLSIRNSKFSKEGVPFIIYAKSGKGTLNYDGDYIKPFLTEEDKEYLYVKYIRQPEIEEQRKQHEEALKIKLDFEKSILGTTFEEWDIDEKNDHDA